MHSQQLSQTNKKITQRGDSQGFKFNVDWFSEHEGAWTDILGTRFSHGGPFKALVVGPYEGRVVVWMAQNLSSTMSVTVLADFAKYPHCVSYKDTAVWTKDVKAVYNHNLDVLQRSKLLSLVDGNTDTALLKLAATETERASYDIVYIDCSSSSQALDSATLALRLLSSGGILVMTNNVHSRLHDASCPRRGIDAFLDAKVAEVKVVRNGFHIFIEKRTSQLQLSPCRAEYFDGTEKDNVCPPAQ